MNTKSKLVTRSILNSLGVLIYVGIVSQLIAHSSQLFGPIPEHSFFAPMAFLLLLVLSAAVVGSLIFLKPAMLYMEGNKREGITLLFLTLIVLAVLTVIFLAFLS